MNTPDDDAQMSPIRVLVVDDHTLFRRGLTALLACDARLAVVGDAADAGQALRRAHEHAPDVILLDNHLPGVNGIDDSRMPTSFGPSCSWARSCSSLPT